MDSLQKIMYICIYIYIFSIFVYLFIYLQIHIFIYIYIYILCIYWEWPWRVNSWAIANICFILWRMIRFIHFKPRGFIKSRMKKPAQGIFLWPLGGQRNSSSWNPGANAGYFFQGWKVAFLMDCWDVFVLQTWFSWLQSCFIVLWCHLVTEGQALSIQTSCNTNQTNIKQARSRCFAVELVHFSAGVHSAECWLGQGYDPIWNWSYDSVPWCVESWGR